MVLSIYKPVRVLPTGQSQSCTRSPRSPRNANSTESKFMPANAVAENVLGTLGVFLLLCCSQPGCSVMGV